MIFGYRVIINTENVGAPLTALNSSPSIYLGYDPNSIRGRTSPLYPPVSIQDIVGNVRATGDLKYIIVSNIVPKELVIGYICESFGDRAREAFSLTPGEYSNIVNNYRQYLEAVKDESAVKESYKHTIDRTILAKNNLVQSSNKINALRKLGMEDGKKKFVYENVVASDTDNRGEDIELGTIEITVDFLNKDICTISGTHPRNTSLMSNACHPHHIGPSTLCFGSMSPDILEAIDKVNVDVLQVLLHQFTHSYTSSDTAGKHWKLWSSDPSRLVEDDIYPDDDVVYSDVYGDYIPADDAVYVDHRDTYVYAADAVWSDVYGENIYLQDAVRAEDAGWILRDDEDYVLIDDEYYHIDDTCVDIHGDTVVHDNCVFSEALNEYILKEEAIEHGGQWYTEDTLPIEEEEEEETEEESTNVEPTNQE